MRATVRSRRLLPSLLAGVVVAAGLVALDAPAADAAAPRTTKTVLASGVTEYHQTYTKSGVPQSVYWVATTLSAHAGVAVGSPGNTIGAAPMTTLAMAKQQKAIAGLNGDTFYFDNSPKGRSYTPTLGPRGGIMRNGTLLKAPLDGQNAVLAVTGTNHDYIGPVGYVGTLTAPTGGPKKIASVNSVESAWNGNITFVDHNRIGHPMLGSCSEVNLKSTSTAGRYLVTAIHSHISTYTRIPWGQRALLTCTSKSTDNLGWFTKNLHPGRTYVNVSVTYRSKGLRTLISGVRKLVSGGKAYNDKAGLNVYGNQRTSETFVCVNKAHTVVSFGVFEGKKSGATGVTYAEETSWLTSHGCWDGMAVDGSTSAQLVTQRPHSSLKLQNRPLATQYPGAQRPQVDGIFVVTK